MIAIMVQCSHLSGMSTCCCGSWLQGPALAVQHEVCFDIDRCGVIAESARLSPVKRHYHQALLRSSRRR